jgi:hypothetical protein
VNIAASEREQLEQLCRYVSRPPVATERLALTASAQVRYTLKTPYRDGTSHIVLEPPEVIARILAHLERTAPQPHQPRAAARGAGTAGALQAVLNSKRRALALVAKAAGLGAVRAGMQSFTDME